MQRRQHGPGVRGGRDRPAGDRAGGVVDERRHPRRAGRAPRRQHQDRQVLVVALPHLVAERRSTAQVHQLRPAGPFPTRRRRSRGWCQLRGERPLQRPLGHRRRAGPPGQQILTDRHASHRRLARDGRSPGAMHRGDVAPKVDVGRPVSLRQPEPPRRRRRAGQPTPHAALRHAQGLGDLPHLRRGQLAGLAQLPKLEQRRVPLLRARSTPTRNAVSHEAASSSRAEERPPASSGRCL